jgi:hypothetical protein
MTTSKASEAFPPCSVGLVSGSMIFSCSMTEPGQPCVTISGSASWCGDRTWMKWISTPVDFGLELRQRVQPRLARAPIVIGRPVAGELGDRGQLHTLSPVVDQFPGRPARCGDALAKLGERVVGDIDPERMNLGFTGHASRSPLGRKRRASGDPGLDALACTLASLAPKARWLT